MKNLNQEKYEALYNIWFNLVLYHPQSQRIPIDLDDQVLQCSTNINENLSELQFIKIINKYLIDPFEDPLTGILEFSSDYDDHYSDSTGYFVESNQNALMLKITHGETLYNISKVLELNSIIWDNQKSQILIDLRWDRIPKLTNYLEKFFLIFLDRQIHRLDLIGKTFQGWSDDTTNNPENGDYRVKYELYSDRILKPINQMSFLNQVAFFDDIQSIEKLRIIPIKPVIITNKTSFSLLWKLLIDLYQMDIIDLYIEETGQTIPSQHSHSVKFMKNYALVIPGILPLDFNFQSIPRIKSDITLNGFFIKYSKNQKENVSNNDLQQENTTINVNQNVSNKYSAIYKRIFSIMKTKLVLEKFFPYPDMVKYPTDSIWKDWYKKIKEKSNENEFKQLLENIISHFPDGHISLTNENHKKFYPPFYFKIINREVIITELLELDQSNFKVGDKIIEIENELIENINAKLFNKKGDSDFNKSIFRKHILNRLLSDTRVTIKIERLNNRIEVEYIPELSIFQYITGPSNNDWFEMMDNILYINLKHLPSPQSFHKLVTTNLRFQGLILDNRGYPPAHVFNTVGYFCEEPNVFEINSTPLVNASFDDRGIVQNHKHHTSYQIIPKQPYISVPTYILIDESVISMSETLCMFLKEMENISFVGQNTFGTTGAITNIKLLDGYVIRFTGTRIHNQKYLNFHMKGIVPDYYVIETQEDILDQTDKILFEAHRILRENLEKSE